MTVTTTTDPPGDVIDALAGLGFRASRDALVAFFTHAHKSRLGPTQVAEQLVALERRAREATNLARRTRMAYLGKFKPIDRFDWSHPRKIDRALIEKLLGLDFIHRGENVLLRGQSGVAKTMLAKNLGHAALLAGHTVRFTTLAAALADLLQQESIPAFRTPPQALSTTAPSRARRARLRAGRFTRCRHALRHHQPTPRAPLHRHQHQSRLQAVGHRLPRRRLRRCSRRPLRPALPQG